MKIFTGKVVAKKMAKTATVEIERIVAHSLYQKRLKKVRKYQVHDEKDETKVGQTVRFIACAPISKMKKWKIVGTGGKK
jgi:small subunit ribosomal protein S17